MNRIAIFGAGPSGFYASDQLLKAGFEVDLYDRLPTPYGLVRAGVAPDHPKIKSVTRMYDKTAKKPGFRYFGGVELGKDITREELLQRYHAVLYAFGTATDNRLGIPGEDLLGSHPATDFVAWYNAHPDYAELEFELTHPTAVVIGNGNVAVDVARMLVLAADELAATDTADHAISAFGVSQVRDVILLGRRGPAQAAFTTPELRELGELSRADVVVHPEDLELDELSATFLEEEADATAKRNVELLREYSTWERSGDKTHTVELRFLTSPVEILGTDDGRVKGVRVVKNRIESSGGRMKAVPTGEESVIECGLVLRAVGYRGEPVAGIPFDDKRGLIRNDDGRVMNDDGTQATGEYAVGWIKRGPSGVIGTNKKCAAGTTEKIVADREAGKLGSPSDELADPAAIDAWLRDRIGDRLVTWDGWLAIDEHETALGEPQGRPRVKLIDIDEMTRVASGVTA